MAQRSTFAAATDSREDVRVDEYETTEGKVFSVFTHSRLLKRVTRKREPLHPKWTDAFGIRLRPEEAEHLEEIHKKRAKLPKVFRFPRFATDTNHRYDRHSIETATSTVLTWLNIPQFDPSRVRKTRWLVKPFLAEGSIQLVYGAPGSFKSTILLAVAKAVASGEEFLGMPTKRRRVLYFDYENPGDVIKRRCQDLGLVLPSDGFKIWDRFTGGSPPKPGATSLEELVRDCVETTGYGPWLIFDSWSSLLNPGEGGELTGQIAYKFLELRKLADLGATITVIDHTRKYDKDVLYGGQDKEAKSDTIHSLRLFEKANAAPVVLIDSRLKRYAPKNDRTLAIEFEGSQDRKGNWHIRKIRRVENPEVEQERRHIELLRTIILANPRAGQEQIAKLAAEEGLARDAAIRLLKAGIGQYWKREKVGHNKSQFRLLEHK